MSWREVVQCNSSYAAREKWNKWCGDCSVCETFIITQKIAVISMRVKFIAYEGGAFSILSYEMTFSKSSKLYTYFPIWNLDCSSSPIQIRVSYFVKSNHMIYIYILHICSSITKSKHSEIYTGPHIVGSLINRLLPYSYVNLWPVGYGASKAPNNTPWQVVSA